MQFQTLKNVFAKIKFKDTLVVYIVRLKVTIKMRRWSLMVNFTGQYKAQQNKPWHEPVKLATGLHLRISMGTLRHTIYTTKEKSQHFSNC